MSHKDVENNHESSGNFMIVIMIDLNLSYNFLTIFVLHLNCKSLYYYIDECIADSNALN